MGHFVRQGAFHHPVKTSHLLLTGSPQFASLESLRRGGKMAGNESFLQVVSEDNGTLGLGNNSLQPKPSLEPFPTFNDMSMIKTVVLSLMFVISLIGNVATLVQMYRLRRRKSTINTLILQLATADLIVTFSCNVTDAVWASTMQWYAGDVLCRLIKFIQVFGLYLSTYIVVIISLDRCMAILDPMGRNKAPRRVRIMIAVAWLSSAFFSLPQVYIFRVVRGPWEQDFYQCHTQGAYTADWQGPFYSTMTLVLMFLLPLFTMITAYMLIFCTIAQKSQDLQREESANTEMLSRGPVRGQLFRKAKVKSLRMTALIVAAFVICWTPYYVVFIIMTYTNGKIDQNAFRWIFFFGMANSMVNPMIYGAFHCRKRRRSNCERYAMPWYGYGLQCIPSLWGESRRVATSRPTAATNKKSAMRNGSGTQSTEVVISHKPTDVQDLHTRIWVEEDDDDTDREVKKSCTQQPVCNRGDKAVRKDGPGREPGAGQAVYSHPSLLLQMYLIKLRTDHSKHNKTVGPLAGLVPAKRTA